MALVQGDDVVKPLTSATANPALRNSVSPGALDGGLEASNPHGANRRGNFQPVFCVVIKDKEPRSGLIGKRFSQLLDNPTARRMPGNIEMQDAPAVMTDNQEAIEETKADRRNGEKVHGRCGFAVIAQKSQPLPSGFRGGRDETVIRDYIRNQEQEDKRLDQMNLWR